MCHIGQSFSEWSQARHCCITYVISTVLIGSIQHGTCVIQPTTIAFSSEELVDLVTRCGLNRLNQFAAFLAVHLRRSRSDSKLLSVLCGLDEVLYSGLPLPRDEEVWAYTNGIPLKVWDLLLYLDFYETDAHFRIYLVAPNVVQCFFLSEARV